MGYSPREKIRGKYGATENSDFVPSKIQLSQLKQSSKSSVLNPLQEIEGEIQNNQL
jgi:hypothetical protein